MRVDFKNAQLWFVCVVIMTGCASTYRPINPPAFSYRDTKETSDSILISYAYDIQFQSRNFRYSRKERKFSMNAVALRIVNHSGNTVTITRDNFTVSVDSEERKFVEPAAYVKRVKQHTGFHLLHALWGPWSLTWRTDSNGETDVDFIYIPVGAIVGIGNAMRASNANKAHLEILNAYEIWNKEIKPGEMLYGIITISNPENGDLRFALKK